ncbi:molybdopterin-dependent oxidoreductase [Pseudonocardia acaciae]|uniref:molybdopterin-dependent oxidoreductase n=1 Tax=Pseudonocardia acaciae TaxID=551276 RepID=UPI0009FE1A4E|nr:molybdopterin-dependent oxidoreductase [Pseudonocardia acaciae]
MAALGVGQLAAGLVAPASAPVLAVADAVVRLSPEWLTEIGKGLEFPALGLVKGVADKVALLAGIGGVVLLLAAAAGVASRRRPLPGRLLIVALGAAGLAAVVSSPVFGPAHLVAPLAALVVGLAAFDALRILATGHSADGEPRLPARRGALLGIAAVGAGALATGLGGLTVAATRTTRPGTITAARPAPPVPPGADFAQVGTPTFVTDNRDFYRIDTAIQVPRISAEDWSLRVHGMVDTPLRLGYDDLLAGPLLERTITLTCVSNEVNGGLISTANFTGVSLRELLLRAGPRPGADQIHSTSVDGWTAGTPTDVVMRPDSDALLAVAMNGQPLPPEHGYPVRMVVPGLYGFVSATKWLTDLELTTFDATQAYWTRRGWAQRAPIKTQSRIDRPRPLATVTPGPNGQVTLAGIAWAQTRGIDKVEVRLDEAGAWRPAQLSAQVNRATWRMWRLDVPLAPGSHFVQCRATDATGATQTPQPAPPIPDGAAGWPGIRFTVA